MRQAGFTRCKVGARRRQALAAYLLVGIACNPMSVGSVRASSLEGSSQYFDQGSALAKILTREMWGAQPAMDGVQPQEPLSIILHHTGVRSSPKLSLESKMRALQSFSQQRAQVSETRSRAPWPDVPYHYYIDPSGRIAEGRDVRYKGDTNTDYDVTGHIQIALEGNFEHELPTKQQLEAARDLLTWLTLSWDIPIKGITSHKDHAKTVCPGKHLLEVLPQLLSTVDIQRTSIIASMCTQGRSHEFPRVRCSER